MEIRVRINGAAHALDVRPNELLLRALHRAGFYDVKHGCESGECGARATLLRR